MASLLSVPAGSITDQLPKLPRIHACRVEFKNSVSLQWICFTRDEHGNTGNHFPSPLTNGDVRRQTTRKNTMFVISMTELPAVTVCCGLTTQEGTALLVGEGDAPTGALAIKAVSSLEDPNEGQDGEGKGGPVDKAAEV